MTIKLIISKEKYNKRFSLRRKITVKTARDIRTQLYHDRGFIFVLTRWHALYVLFNKKWVMVACQKMQLQWCDISLSVFCAVGSLGKAVSRYIAHDSLPKEIILIDLPNKINLLTNLAAEIQQYNRDENVKFSIYVIVKQKSLPIFNGTIFISNHTVPSLTAENLPRAHFWTDDYHHRVASIEAKVSACNNYYVKGNIAGKNQITKDSVSGISTIATIKNVATGLEKYQSNTGPFFRKGEVILC
jgi:hypothetical protein